MKYGWKKSGWYEKSAKRRDRGNLPKRPRAEDISIEPPVDGLPETRRGDRHVLRVKDLQAYLSKTGKEVRSEN